MTGVIAYDGQTGWKIEPWQGKKDAEPLGEEELKEILEDADFDGPLIDYQQKGNKVEFVGMEPVEGTDAWKLKVTLKNGDVQYYYMDTGLLRPHQDRDQAHDPRRGAGVESTLGDYKQVAGWFLPHSIEQGRKGSPKRCRSTKRSRPTSRWTTAASERAAPAAK